MGQKTNQMSVVDHQLKVHGIQNLRVVDASIMLKIASASLDAAVMTIVEKGANQILGRN